MGPGQSAWGLGSAGHRHDPFSRLTTILYQDTMGQSASVWNGVAQVQLSYGRDARLKTMSWHSATGEAMDAKVCWGSASTHPPSALPLRRGRRACRDGALRHPRRLKEDPVCAEGTCF